MNTNILLLLCFLPIFVNTTPPGIAEPEAEIGIAVPVKPEKKREAGMGIAVPAKPEQKREAGMGIAVPEKPEQKREAGMGIAVPEKPEQKREAGMGIAVPAKPEQKREAGMGIAVPAKPEQKREAGMGIAVPEKPEQKREAQLPQQDCYEQCKNDGKTKVSCEKFCTVLTPMERHVTSPLDANCVKECNGGEVTGENPLKPECEQKCLFQQPSPVVVFKREADSEETGCKKECNPTEDGRGQRCKITCSGKLPGSGRVTGQLDRACVEECQGGVFPTKLEELKPECEQKCPFRGQAQVFYKKTEFTALEPCLNYCQEKGIGQNEAECKEKCHHTFSGMAQG